MSTPSDIGRALANLRREKPGTCPVCGRPFTAKGPARYCSQACRQAAYYQRHRDTILARRKSRPQEPASPADQH